MATLLLFYLIGEVSGEMMVLPGEVMIIQLSQMGPEHVLTTEERVVGEDHSRNINIELEVSIEFCSTGDI